MDPVETLWPLRRSSLKPLTRSTDPRCSTCVAICCAPPTRPRTPLNEVFLQARKKLSTYDPSKPLSNWLAGIASHYCIDQLRRRTVEHRLFEPAPADELHVASPTPSPLNRLLSAERGETVRAALVVLPDRYRVPLVLTYYWRTGLRRDRGSVGDCSEYGWHDDLPRKNSYCDNG